MQVINWLSFIINAIRIRCNRRRRRWLSHNQAAGRRSIRRMLAAAALTPLLVAASNGDQPLFPNNSFPVGDSPRSVTTGDFNGDGVTDLATANGNAAADNVSVLLNQGVMLGDVNLDCSVDLLDVAPFVARLVASEFQAQADINQDGDVNLLDVAPFVDLLTAG